MEISEVRVKLVEKSSERLRAFCSITLDGDFVIRDLKIIDGVNGAFVAMPSRKLSDHCSRCGCKNHLRAKYCNECGNKLNENRAPKDAQGRAKLHADVAHPINAACRERIQNAVTKAFYAELEKAKSPDYKPPKYDDFADDFETDPDIDEGINGIGKETSSESKSSDKDQNGFSDYDSLIADLKREAVSRRKKQRNEHRERPASFAPDTPADNQPDEELQPSSLKQSGKADGRSGKVVQPPVPAPSPPATKPAEEKIPDEDDNFGAGIW